MLLIVQQEAEIADPIQGPIYEFLSVILFYSEKFELSLPSN